MGANSRSTVGTATDALTMLRIVFSRLGKPHVGPSVPFQLQRAGRDVPAVRGDGPGHRHRRRRVGRPGQVAERRCDDDPRLLHVDGWYCAPTPSPGSSTRTRRSRTTRRRSWTTSSTSRSPRSRVNDFNITYEGLIPKVQKAFLSKDREAMQPHIRAFVDRAVTFTACPECGGARLNQAALSSKVRGINIAECVVDADQRPRRLIAGLDDPDRSRRWSRPCGRRSTRSSRSASAI